MGKEELLLRFTSKLGYSPNMDNPKTFNEKILWRKVYDRRQLLVDMTDKHKAKSMVDCPVEEIGHGIHHKPQSYPFIARPNHFSGATKLVQSSNEWLRLKTFYKRLLREKYGQDKDEWAYSQIQPRLMIEPKLEGLHEIKCFCFHGKCELVRYMPPRSNFNTHPPERMGESYHLPSGKRLPIKVKKNKTYKGEVPDLIPIIKKAESFSDIDHVRVDMYFNGKIYFGEFTMYSGSGLMQFSLETDHWLGSFWNVH